MHAHSAHAEACTTTVAPAQALCTSTESCHAINMGTANQPVTEKANVEYLSAMSCGDVLHRASHTEAWHHQGRQTVLWPTMTVPQPADERHHKYSYNHHSFPSHAHGKSNEQSSPQVLPAPRRRCSWPTEQYSKPRHAENPAERRAGLRLLR